MENEVLIKEETFEKARKRIRENKGEKIIFTSNDDELNRKVAEKEEINNLLLSQSGRKDRLKQRNSGLNQVVAKIAKKKNISIGINLDEIIDSNAKTKAEILGRVKQNVKLCNKNKLKMKFISQKYKKDSYDLKALGLVLGMPTNMLKC